MKKRNIAVIALVVVLLAAGFALPELVLALRDAALEERDDQVPVDTTPMGALAASLTGEEKLRLVGEQGYTDFIPLNAGVNLTELEAKRAAEKLMGDITEIIFFYPEWSCQEIYPRLAVGSDGRSFVLWRAILACDMANGELILDDETGKALGFALYGDEENGMEPGMAQDPVPDVEMDDATLFELAMTVLRPFDIDPYGVYPEVNGGLVLAENGKLTVRITVYNGNWPRIRVNC